MQQKLRPFSFSTNNILFTRNKKEFQLRNSFLFNSLKILIAEYFFQA